LQSFPCLLPLLYDLLRWWLLSKGRAGRHGLLGVLLFLILQLDPSAPVIGNRLAELLVLIPYKTVPYWMAPRFVLSPPGTHIYR